MVEGSVQAVGAGTLAFVLATTLALVEPQAAPGAPSPGDETASEDPESPEPQAKVRWKVAVAGFRVVGFEGNEGKAIRTNVQELIAANVSDLGHDVVSQADIEAMLADAKQLSLEGCDDTACLAEIGGALGVDRMITGNISLLGKTYQLSLTLVDVGRSLVERRFGGNAGAVAALIETAGRGVQRLFGVQRLREGTGILVVKTLPSGSEVFLDGEPVGVSPVTVDGVSSGVHQVEAKFEDLKALERVTVRASQVSRTDLELVGDRSVQLRVSTNPPDCQAFLDGQPVGTTPLILKHVSVGEHHLRLEKEEHYPRTASFETVWSEDDAGPPPHRIRADVDDWDVVEFSVLGGAVMDLNAVANGVTTAFEARASLFRGAQLGIGLVGSETLTLRAGYLALWEVFELGAHFRTAFFPYRPAEGAPAVWRTAIGGGVGMGLGFRTNIGRFGIRAEVELASTLGGAGLSATYPLTMSTYWRY